jgi:hypothetical protein
VVINFRDPDYSAESGDFIRLKYGLSVRIMNGISIMSQTLVTWGESTRSWKKKLIFAGRELCLPLSDWGYFTGSREE